ncbi:MAG: hypothetical protein DHS20C11_24180 [Lysobacteraceae bacterium]|nr:MAG: hypothetical protein DHS20C11_24180 [Xanthomonadaceae bacterium]
MQYTLNPTTYGIDANKAPLYAAVDGRVASLGGTHCVFHVHRNGERHVLTHDVLRALDLSRQFATLDEHTNRACDTIAGLKGQFTPIRKAYEDLADKGLLLSADAWITQMHQGPHQSEAAPIAALYVRTCDRPQNLQRLLSSLASFESVRSVTIKVVDDSRDAENEKANAEQIEDAGKRHGLKVEHITRQQRHDRIAAWKRELELDSAQADTVDWLLQPGQDKTFSGGAAWNYAVLDSAGQRIFCLDDDFVVNPRQHPDAVDRALFDNGLPDFIRFAVNDDEMNELLEPAGIDPFAVHQATCGYSVAELLDGEPGRLLKGQDLRGKTLAELDHLTGASRVVVSTNGAWGHGRSDHLAWMLTADRAARESWVGDEQRYQQISNEPRAICSSPATFIGRFLTHTPMSVDNSQMIPFAAPRGRGEDYLLSALISFCYPKAAFVHFPWALQHCREEAHQTRGEAQPWTPMFSRMIAANARMEEEHCLAEDPAARIRWLAAHTRMFAEASPSKRVQTIEEFNVLLRSGLLQQLEQRVAEDEEPAEYWAADVAQLLHANGTALTKGRAVGFADWPGLEPEILEKQSATEARRYADAMELWPELWAKAAQQSAG